jgi:peptide/nickel transport system substrate-binding protein
MYTSGFTVDPQQTLSNYLCSQLPGSENTWGGGNIPRACNEEYDTLFEQLTQTPVGPEREAIVKQMNDIIIQNYYQIPLVNRGGVSAFIDGLEGIWMNDWDSELWNIAEWSRAE